MCSAHECVVSQPLVGSMWCTSLVFIVYIMHPYVHKYDHSLYIQVFNIVARLVTNIHAQGILNYVFLLHPGYGYVYFM